MLYSYSNASHKPYLLLTRVINRLTAENSDPRRFTVTLMSKDSYPFTHQTSWLKYYSQNEPQDCIVMKNARKNSV